MSFLCWILGTVAIFSIALNIALTRKSITLPFPDRGFSIFAAKDGKAFDVIREIFAANGMPVEMRKDSTDVMRDIYPGGTIVNLNSDRLWDVLGNPSGGIALVTRKPLEAAKAAAEMLREAGCTATVIPDFDRDVKPGKMVGVTTDALEAGMLVFRRHILLMGGRPKKWTAREPAQRQAL